MNLKLFSCHHFVPQDTVSNEIFCPIVTGLPHFTGEAGILSDARGENISSRVEFSDLRQQFFVWKNLSRELDFIGFEHYRRPLFIDVLPYERLADEWPAIAALRRTLWRDMFEWNATINPLVFGQYLAMRRAFDGAEIAAIKRWVASSDVITVRPVHNESMAGQWMRHHPAHVWEAMCAALDTSAYFTRRPRLYDLDVRSKYYLNIYILSAALFNEYMEFWWEIVSKLAQAFPAPERRMWGFVSERLFTIFLDNKRMEQPLMKVTEVPHLLVDNIYQP